MSQKLKYLKLPLHVAQLATGTKSFQKNPVIGNAWLNEHGLHVKRVALAARMADFRRKRLATKVTPSDREQYAQNGYVQINDFLSDEVFEAVMHEIESAGLRRFDMLQGSTVTRRAMIDGPDIAACTGLRTAKNDPRLTALIQYVSSHAGQPLLTVQAVMARASEQKQGTGGMDPQTFLHSDTFHATAKAWLFLTDVDESDGPFSYVAGSHRMTEQRYAWEKTISQAPNAIENIYSARGSLRTTAGELENMGYPSPTIMAVKANTLIVADTHGFHARCASPKDTTRIEIYGSLRRNPFSPFTGLHYASAPYIKDRTNTMMIDGLARLERWGVRNTPWISQGRGPVQEWSSLLDASGEISD